jgi:hypothetical protein
MPWVEINLHTGERIAHTTTSLENRLRALRASIDTLMRLGELVIDERSLRFVFVEDYELARYPYPVWLARPNGAWGLEERRIKWIPPTFGEN